MLKVLLRELSKLRIQETLTNEKCIFKSHHIISEKKLYILIRSEDFIDNTEKSGKIRKPDKFPETKYIIFEKKTIHSLKSGNRINFLKRKSSYHI